VKIIKVKRGDYPIRGGKGLPEEGEIFANLVFIKRGCQGQSKEEGGVNNVTFQHGILEGKILFVQKKKGGSKRPVEEG